MAQRILSYGGGACFWLYTDVGEFPRPRVSNVHLRVQWRFLQGFSADSVTVNLVSNRLTDATYIALFEVVATRSSLR